MVEFTENTEYSTEEELIQINKINDICDKTLESFINIKKIEDILENKYFEHKIFNIIDINYDIYLTIDDYNNNLALTDNDIILRNSEIISLYDQINDILNYDNLEEGDKIESVKVFIEKVNNCIQYIVNQMIENTNWVFNPMEKFIWIYTELIIRFEPQLLKYIIKNPLFSSKLLIQQDTQGYFPLLLLCINKDYNSIKLLNDNDLLKSDMFIAESRKYMIPVKYLLFDTNIYKYLCENLEGFEELTISYIFNLSCFYNIEIANYLLKSKYLTELIFNEKYLIKNKYSPYEYENYSCLMLSMFKNNNDLFINLLNHELCNQNIIELSNNFGSILNIATLFNKELIQPILNSKFINDKLMLINTINPSNKNSNILFNCLNSTKYFEIILDSKYFNIKLLKDTIENESILHYLAKHNNLYLLKKIINSNYFTNDLILLNNNGMTFFNNIIDKLFLEKLIDETNLDKSVFFIKNYDNRNQFNIMTINKTLTYNIVKKYILPNPDLLLEENLTNNTLFIDICINQPELGIKIYKKLSNFKKKLLYKENCDMQPYLLILSQTTDDNLFNRIINSKHLSKEELNKLYISKEDIFKIPFLFHISYKNPTKIINYIESKYFDENILLNYRDNDNNNYLHYIFELYNPNENLDNLILKLIEKKYITKELLDEKNTKNKSPLLLLCDINTTGNIIKILIKEKIIDEHSLTNIHISNETPEYEVTPLLFTVLNNNNTIFEILCESEIMTENIFRWKNSQSNILAEAIYNKNKNMVKYILNHKYCDIDLINYGYSKYIEYDKKIDSEDINKYIEILILIIKNNKINEDTLLIKDDKNKNIIMKLLEYQTYEEVINTIVNIINSDIYTEKVLNLSDIYNNTIIQYNLDNKILEALLNNKNMTNKFLLNKNNFNEIFLSQYYHKTDCLKTILISKFFNEELLLYNDNDGRNLLFRIYRKELWEIILNLPFVTKNTLLYCNDDNDTFLHVLLKSIYGYSYTIYSVLEIVDLLITSEKISQELIESQNNMGKTIIHIYPEVLSKLINTDYIRKELFDLEDTAGFNLLIYLIKRNQIDFIKLCEKNIITKEQLINKDFCKSPIIILCDKDVKLFEKILNLKILDNDTLNYKYDNNINILTNLINNNYEQHVEILLNSDYNILPVFNTIFSNGQNILSYALFRNKNIFKLLYESKYTLDYHILEKDKHGHNLIMKIFLKGDIELIKYIIESKYWEDSKYITDNDGDFLLIQISDKPEIIKYMLENKKCDDKMINMRNNLNIGIIHNYTKYPKSIKELVKSEYFNYNMLIQKDVYGNTPLHYACNEIKSAKILINSNHFNNYLLEFKNKKGEIPLIIAIKKNKMNILIELINKGYITDKLLGIKDIKGITVLSYIARYNEKILEIIIENKLITKELIEKRDNKNRTIMIYISKYNPASFKLIKQTEFFNKELLEIGHSEYGSSLTISAKYQPKIVKYILDIPDLSWSFLNIIEDNYNFIQIACVYNSDSLKYILNSKYNFINYFNRYDTNSPFRLAVKYQPDAVNYILNSDYGNEQIIHNIHNDRSSLHDAYDYQPRSLYFIMTSKYLNESKINQEDEIGYKLFYKISLGGYTFNNVNDIHNINLINYNNIKSDDNVCNVCYLFKNQIILIPCHHILCVGCAFKLSKCPQCRTVIEEKSPIFY